MDNARLNSYLEVANEKANKIVKVDLCGEHTEGDLRVEIQRMEKIEGGVQVFARAWKGEKQLGFGDGSIEIERFRFFNPPVLVRDPNGDINRSFTDNKGEIHNKVFREDPSESFKQQLFDVVSSKGQEGTKIIVGKVGNTISTFFPDTGGTGNRRSNGGNYTLEHDALLMVGSGYGVGAVASENEFFLGSYNICRSFLPFDTSAIPDGDVINSATFSLWVTGGTRSGAGSSCTVVQSSQASNTAVADTDWPLLGTTSFGSELNSNMPGGGVAYRDIQLNATGIAFINKTGFTKLGLRDSGDIAATVPTTIDANVVGDGASDANPPKLVIVHSANVNSSFFNFFPN